MNYKEHMERQLAGVDALLDPIGDDPVQPPAAPQGRCIHGEPLTASCDECKATAPPSTPTAGEGARARLRIDVANAVGGWVNAHPEINKRLNFEVLDELVSSIVDELPDFPPTEATQVAVDTHGDMTLVEEVTWRREHDRSVLDSMAAQGRWIERLRSELATARADAIRECVDRVKAIRAVGYNAQFGTMTGVTEGGYIDKTRAITALESLAKGEEDDGPTNI